MVVSQKVCKAERLFVCKSTYFFALLSINTKDLDSAGKGLISFE